MNSGNRYRKKYHTKCINENVKNDQVRQKNEEKPCSNGGLKALSHSWFDEL